MLLPLPRHTNTLHATSIQFLFSSQQNAAHQHEESGNHTLLELMKLQLQGAYFPQRANAWKKNRLLEGRNLGAEPEINFQSE